MMIPLPILLAAMSAIPPAETEKPRILVLDVRAGEAVTPETARILGELLLTEVHASGRYRALGAADMVTILDVEQRRQVVSCDRDAECLAEISAALGVAMLLEASVGKVGAQRVVAVKLIDAEAVKVLAREAETVTDDEALIASIQRLTARLLGLEPRSPLVAEPATDASGVRAGWWIAGGGGLLLAGGALFGGLATHDFSAFQASPLDDSLGDSADARAAVADGLFVAGGVLVSLGLLWLWVGGGGG